MGIYLLNSNSFFKKTRPTTKIGLFLIYLKLSLIFSGPFDHPEYFIDIITLQTDDVCTIRKGLCSSKILFIIALRRV